jgi:putative tryptophan/tyrosine transport system substrate-binding protein
LTAAAYPTLQQAADHARVPIFAFQSSQAQGGAVLVVTSDYHAAGKQSAQLAARVMRGERPASIPFENVATKRVIANPAAARRIGLTLPADVVAHADQVLGVR